MNEISVIVPAYNVENYIDKCISSLLKQTFSNYEIILVDDGSTDRTGAICDRIGNENSIVHVYHKTNGGLSDARNFGIEHANGRFITFIDSDDYVSNSYLKTMYDMITNGNEIDIAMVSTQEILEEDCPEIKEADTIVVSTDEAIKRMLLRQGFQHCGVGKLYQRSLWKTFRFPIGRLYEDYLTTYYVFSKAKKIALKDNKSYYYIQRAGSIMHYTCSERTITLLDVADEVTSFIIKRWPKLKSYAVDLQVASYMKCMQSILKSGFDCFLDTQKRIIKKNKTEFIKYLFSGIKFKEKVKIVSLLFGRHIFMFIYNKKDGSKKIS